MPRSTPTTSRSCRLPRRHRSIRPGTSVVAVTELRPDAIVVAGQGVYLGRQRPPDWMNPHTRGRHRSLWRRWRYERYRDHLILLGDVQVWGVELVWWGREEQVAHWRGLRGRRVLLAAP